MSNVRKTVGLRLSKEKEKPNKLLKVLHVVLKVVRLLSLIFDGIDKLWDALVNMLS